MTGMKTQRSRQAKGDNLVLDQVAKRFEVHNRSDGKSPRTVEWYNEVIELFVGWLREEGMSTSLDEIGEDEARDFILHLQERKGLWGKASSYTVNNRVRALRAFFNWLYQQGYTDTHRMEKVKPPKVRQKEIETFTDEEIDRIFASVNTRTVLGARNAAIYALMLDTGLRLSEVVTLKHKDVHLGSRYVKVLGKGDKERIVAFGANCQRALNNYDLKYRFETEGMECDAFFLTIDGYSMTADALRSLIERLSKAARIPRLHPHLMRHTYATRFLLSGGNVFLLQQNLGHTTLNMVQKYLHVTSRMMAEVSQEFSPLDRVEMRSVKRARHQFNGDGWQGQIYLNVGGSSRKGTGPKNPSWKG